MNVSDIYGTLYSPGDGTINPDGLCQALTRAAKRAGAKVNIDPKSKFYLSKSLIY